MREPQTIVIFIIKYDGAVLSGTVHMHITLKYIPQHISQYQINTNMELKKRRTKVSGRNIKLCCWLSYIDMKTTTGCSLDEATMRSI